ncbi:MAG: hypothetical protein KBS52_06220 [Clostridiales bacterium]|nr:hypothetical protein [Candidatus Equinaster intestinalis]
MAQKTRFRKIWGISVIAFAVLLAGALTVFYIWLKEYENSLPSTVANNYGNEVFARANGEKFLTSGVDTSPYENAEELSVWLAEKAKAGITVASSSAKKEGCDVSFAVNSGDKKIATLYLKKRDKREKLGNTGYEVVSCELDKSFYTEITVKMPKNATLYLNGKEVADGKITENKLPDLSGAGISADKLTKNQILTLSGFIGTPEVTAKIGGKAVEVEKDNGIYTVKPDITENEKKEIERVAMGCAENYAKFMEKDLPFGEVEKYLKANTKFYENVKKSLVKYVFVHDEDIIGDKQVSEFYKYSDNIYSCRVKLTQTVKIHERERVFVDKIDKTVFLIKEGGSFKVLDMQSY